MLTAMFKAEGLRLGKDAKSPIPYGCSGLS